MRHFRKPAPVPVIIAPLPGYKAKTMAAGKLRQKAKLARLIEQGWRCLYCQCHLTRKTATAEHRKPISRGGVDARANIDAACEPCNKAKANLTKREFELAIFNPNLRRDPWPLYLACLDIRLKRRTELACRRLLSIIAAPAVRSERSERATPTPIERPTQ